MPSLTRVDADHRAHLLTVLSYDIDLDLDLGPDVFRSRTRIRCAAADPTATTFVDVAPHELTAATLNGRPLAPSALRDGRLALSGLTGDNELVIDAVMAYSHDGEGLHRYVDPADSQAYLYAMSFLGAAPRWFACFDQPDLKAPVTLQVSCPPDWTVAANGAATRVADGRWRFATTAPLSTYFTTLVAGPYHSITDVHDGIPLAIHARASLAEHLEREAVEMLAVTKACLDEFHRLFGVRYPWGEYHQAFVPEFNAGAMENPGCVTFRDQLVFRSRATEAEHGQRANVIAHEMAHMWFGDLVTMRWWDDLWLNESFAEYLGHRVCDAVTEYPSWVEFGILRKSWGYAADRRPSTHPVAGNGAADAASALDDFDGISYAKGASLLKQLAARLGDEVFLGGLRAYFEAHAYGNAEFADLMSAWVGAGAVDLPDWAARWLRTSGLDTLSVQDGAVHRHPGEGAVSRPHVISVARLDGAGGELGRVVVGVDADSVAVPGGSGSAQLVLANAGDETWAKVALSESDWRAMPSLLPGIADPVTRVVIWNALMLAVADAELAPSAALDVLAAALPAETADAVLTVLLRWALGPLVGAYLADSERGGALARIADAARRAVRCAPSGSGRQLAAVRGLIGAWSDVAGLRGLLDGASVPDGVVVDEELRWLVLERLAALGELGSAEIEAEAARDRSAQGVVHAARCHALRPDPAAKAAAWQALMTDATRSNYELYAIAGGFWHPEQTALTAPYAARYFDEIPATAALRTGWVTGKVAELAYPSTAVDERTLSATADLLARDDLEHGIRRAVIDAGDDLRRALDSRRRFRT